MYFFLCELAINPAFAQASKQFDANRPSAVIYHYNVSEGKCPDVK